MIEFKRILHPVGHGAFFSEHISSRCEDKLHYNVVYDCGSLSKTRIKKEIDNTYELLEENHINLLFISHFDDDHINGLSILKEKGLVNNSTYVFIPYYYPFVYQFIGMEKSSYIKGIEEFFRILSDAKAKIVMVKETDSFYNEETVVFNNDPRLRKAERNILSEYNINNADVYEIISGTRIELENKQKEIIWYYIPFNYSVDQSGTVETTLNEMGLIGTNKKLKTNELLDILSRNSKDEKKKKLQNLYREIEDGTLNTNSLQLLSFCNKKYRFFIRDLKISWYDYPLWLFRDCYYRNCCLCSCLYTGDTDLRDDNKITFTKNIKKKVLGSDLMMIQIPHHGSVNNYNPEICDLAYYAFLNFKPHSRSCSFNESIFSDFIDAGVPVIPVYDTKTEIECVLCKSCK